MVFKSIYGLTQLIRTIIIVFHGVIIIYEVRFVFTSSGNNLILHFKIQTFIKFPLILTRQFYEY